MAVLGLDACRGGWIGIVLAAEAAPRGVWAPTLTEAAQLAGPVDAIAVDIPIGLPSSGHRAADLAAQAVLGPRRSSVFLTPIREVLLVEDHTEATAVSVARTGRGISRQAHGLRMRILETEAFLDSAPAPVWEVHPEVVFTVMGGTPPEASKKTWAGIRLRVDLLGREGIVLDALGAAGAKAAPDDVVDAAACAWSARRLVRGEAVSFPAHPPVDPVTGRPVAIWA